MYGELSNSALVQYMENSIFCTIQSSHICIENFCWIGLNRVLLAKWAIFQNWINYFVIFSYYAWSLGGKFTPKYIVKRIYSKSSGWFSILCPWMNFVYRSWWSRHKYSQLVRPADLYDRCTSVSPRSLQSTGLTHGVLIVSNPPLG